VEHGAPRRAFVFKPLGWISSSLSFHEREGRVCTFSINLSHQWIGFNLLSLHRVQVQRHDMYSLHLTPPWLLRSSGLQRCAREATGGSVPCSRTHRLATNGESGDRTDDLGVAGRPPHPTELQPPPVPSGTLVSIIKALINMFYTSDRWDY